MLQQITECVTNITKDYSLVTDEKNLLTIKKMGVIITSEKRGNPLKI